MKIELGQTKVADKITGFEGVVTARAEYLTGCNQFSLQAPCKDGQYIEPRWFDEGRLVVIDGDKIEPILADKNGADFSAPLK